MLEWLGEVMKLTLFENVLQSLVQGRDKDKLSENCWLCLLKCLLELIQKNRVVSWVKIDIDETVM